MRSSFLLLALVCFTAVVNAQEARFQQVDSTAETEQSPAGSLPQAPATEGFKPVTIEGPRVRTHVHVHHTWHDDDDDYLSRHHHAALLMDHDADAIDEHWAHHETLDAHAHEQREIAQERARLIREHQFHEQKLARAHETYEQRQKRLADLEDRRVALAQRLAGLHREVLEAQKVSGRLDSLAKNAVKTAQATRTAALQVVAAETGIRRKVLDLAKMEAKIKGHAAVIRSIVKKHRRSINSHHPKLVRTLDRLQTIINRLSKHTEFNSKGLTELKGLAAKRPSTPSWHDLKRYITLREKKHTATVLSKLATNHQLGRLSHHMERLINVLTARLSGTAIPKEQSPLKTATRSVRDELLDRRYYALRNEHRPSTRLVLPIPSPVDAHPLSEDESLERLSKIESELSNLDTHVDQSYRASEEEAYFRLHPEALKQAQAPIAPGQPVGPQPVQHSAVPVAATVVISSQQKA